MIGCVSFAGGSHARYKTSSLSFECDQHRVWHFDDPQPGTQLPSGMVALASSTSGLRGVPNAACGNESSRVALHSMVSSFPQCRDRVLLPFESHRLMADPYCHKPVRIWLAPAVRTDCRDTLFAELWPTCPTRCMSAGSFGARQPAEGSPPLYPIAIGLPTLGYGNENPRCLGFCSKRLGYQPHHYWAHDVLDAAMIQLSSSHSPRSLDQWMRGFYCPYNHLGTSPQVMSFSQ